MKAVVGVHENEEAKVEDSVSHVAGSIEHIAADPVVYKLVRVDGDGRLVPATDDEIMVVEDFLVDDCAHIVSETGQLITYGTLASDNIEAVTKKMPHELAVDAEKPNMMQEETVAPLTPSSDHSSAGQPGNLEKCSNPPGGLILRRSRISAIGSSWKPDFSKLKGELCLDNLTVKELQETFRATFGRETSVKDKQWLKRRIIIGLTNSCDFSATSFVIKDGTVVKKTKEQTSRSMDDKVLKDPVAEIASQNCGGLSIHHYNQMEDHISGIKAQDSSMEYDSVSEDLNIEQRATKRVRKPTKRYIEELSEVEARESSGKSISPNRHFRHAQLRQESRVRSVPNVSSNRAVVTRQDSLGGSGVQVPYVSRIRRGRPRENIMALVKLQPNGISMEAARLVKKGLAVRSPRPANKKGNKFLKSRLSPGWIQWPVTATGEKGNQHLDRKFMELDNGTERQNMNSSADCSDDNAVTMTMPQSGMRRKHHRPWTLSEVVKLVEGVTKYGAGRWSEIKRVDFASSPYRTSVDLKDKWRNLLRASFAQLPAEKGIQNSRKHSSIPIPAAILLRVRELAEVQAVVPPIVNAGKIAAHNSGSLGRNVPVTGSGYL